MDLKALNAARGNGRFTHQPTANIPVRVESYDTSNPDRHLCTGTRLDTGETAQFFLRPDPDADKRRKPRSEIKDFASNPRQHKSSTDVGGVIRFDRCFEMKDQPGVYSSAWAAVQSHTAEQAQVMVGLARVLPPREFDGKVRQTTEMVFPEGAIVARSPDQLKHAVVEALSRQVPGATGAFLNFDAVDGQGVVKPQVLRIPSTASRNEATGEMTKDAPEVSFDKWSNSALGKVVMEQMAQSADAKVSVIPMTRLPIGADTITTTVDSGQTLDKKFKFKDGDGYGFAEASVAVRATLQNGEACAPFVTDAAPLRNDRVFYAPEAIPTPSKSAAPAPLETADIDTGMDQELELDGSEIGLAPTPPSNDAMHQLDAASRRRPRP